MKKRILHKVMICNLFLACTFLLFTACGSSDRQASGEQNDTAETPDSQNYPVATIRLEDGGIIKAELYPEIAPNTVNNFISLANKGFYNGLIFHRVIDGFMIQGGDPTGSGNGGPGYTIAGEFSENGFQNDLKHTSGVLSMARSSNPDSAGSQFFIMHGDASWLDGQYASFGKVISGMEVVDRIAKTETDSADRPVKQVVIQEISVETFGVSYPEPEIQK